MPEEVKVQQGQLQNQEAQPMDKEAEAYVTGLMKLLHGKETASKVVAMLKSAPPEQSIPQTAILVNSQMESAARSKGKEPSLDTKFIAGQYLVTDLIEIGNAAGIFQLDTEEQIAPILKNTFQVYIEKGLKDGTIDPIELQQKVEPLMTDEHRQLGIQAAEKTGVPLQPNQETAMEMYADKRVRQQGALRGGM